jgi:hypothetical protein
MTFKIAAEIASRMVSDLDEVVDGLDKEIQALESQKINIREAQRILDSFDTF